MRLIDADELIERIEGYNDTMFYSTTQRIIHDAKIEFAIDEIQDAPTVETEPVRHGYWKSPDCYLTCSLCGAYFDRYDDSGQLQNFAYCPSCGAKMDLQELYKKEANKCD